MFRQILLALTMGIVGGILSGVWSGSYTASAQVGAASLIETRRLRIVDADGKLRAELGLDEKGSVYLVFVNGDSDHENLRLVGPRNSAGRVMFETGGPTLDLSSSDDFGPSIYLSKAGFEPSLVLTLAGEPQLAVGNILSRRTTIIPASLTLHDGSSLRVHMGAWGRNSAQRVDEGASLVLRDSKGNERAILGNTELTDRRGEKIVRSESSLTLLDAEGKVVSSLP